MSILHTQQYLALAGPKDAREKHFDEDFTLAGRDTGKYISRCLLTKSHTTCSSI